MMKEYPFKNDEALIEKMADTLSEDALLKDFFMENDVSYDQIKAGINALMTYKNEFHNCEKNKEAYKPILEMDNGEIVLSYVPCEALLENQSKSFKTLIDAKTMPKTLLSADLADFRQDSKGRQAFYQTMMQTLHGLKLKTNVKGAYLYGPYMAGKTYALAAAANQFSKHGYSVTIMYYPDFTREIKSSIDQKTLESKVKALKEVDVLMLDDLGGEAFSAWIRDEILGPILQHRLLDQKLMYFSSNIPPSKLIESFKNSDNDQEKLKAYRIVERIQALADPIAF